MGALKLKAIAHKGTLTIAVPKEFNEKELDIIISTSEKDVNKKEPASEKKIKSLLNIVGTAKYPDFPVTKYDTYEQ